MKNKVILPVLTVLIGLVIFVFFIWLIFFDTSGALFGKSRPPKPSVTYAEFPFTLTYKIGEETVTVNDVYVCEFQGTAYSWELGSHVYEWKDYIQSTGEYAVYITEDEDRTVYCSMGDVEYYMGEYAEYFEKQTFEPYFYSKLKEDQSTKYMSSSELTEQFKLEIIDYHLSEPIQLNLKNYVSV